MDTASVYHQLNDLPTPFIRNGVPYTQWIDALAFGLQTGTNFFSGLPSQQYLPLASGGWLDVWGELFGISRAQNESDTLYRNRALFLLNAIVGTVIGIEELGYLVFQAPITVTESPSGGYTIVFPGNATSTQIASFETYLQRIRPAGVPYLIEQQTGGLYLSTFNYLSPSDDASPYLSSATSSIPPTIPSFVTNSAPILPDILLTDPVMTSAVTV